MKRMILLGLMVVGALVLAQGPASAQTPPTVTFQQEIALSPGWNLISLQVEPTDPAVGAVVSELISRGTFEAVWGYDASCECWSGFQAGDTVLNTRAEGVLTEVHGLKGYWIKVSDQEVLSVEGGYPSPFIAFQPGWNLIGLPGLFSGYYEIDIPSVFRSHLNPGNEDLLQVWRFDTTYQTFKGWDLTSSPARRDFINFEPGRGYWIYAAGAFALSPDPQFLMEGDYDWEPYGNFPGPEDWDYNGDGYFDKFDSQDTLKFQGFQQMSSVTISNQGGGVIDWVVQGSPPWLRFDQPYGSSSSDNDSVVVRVIRDHLIPGTYSYRFWLISNYGDLPVDVVLEVPEIDGDYKGQAVIETVNNKSAAMPPGEIYMSAFKDSSGKLHAVIDGEKSLTFLDNVHLSGRYYEQGTNKFILSGAVAYEAGDVISINGSTLERSSGDPDNPLPYPIMREITMIGDRVNWNHLQGEYIETITGALPYPVEIRGTFSLLLLQQEKLTAGEDLRPIHKPIIEYEAVDLELGTLDGGTIVSEIYVNQDIYIDALDVNIYIEHAATEELSVVLESPAGTQVLLHHQTDGIDINTTYDQYTLPVDGDTAMDRFVGEVAGGTWTLYVGDSLGGESGTLHRWALYIDGIQLYSVSGQVLLPGGAPAVGADVTISGGGDVIPLVADSGGGYSYDLMFPGKYTITASRFGFEDAAETVWIEDQDEIVPDLTLSSLSAPSPSFVAGPLYGDIPLTVSFVGVSIPVGCNSLTYYFGDGSPSFTTVSADEIVEHTYVLPGRYMTGMDYCSTPSATTHTVLVGPPTAVDGGTTYVISFAAQSGGGYYEPTVVQKSYLADSVNFNLDRAPVGNFPGPEDTEYFLAPADYRAVVNIGAPVIGFTFADDKVLDIGPNTNR